MRPWIASLALASLLLAPVLAQAQAAGPASDVFPTQGGELKITLLGHASLYFTYQGKVIQVDPFSKVADYAALPQADLVLITHHHRDHLDPEALAKTRKEGAPVFATELVAQQVPGATVLRNGDKAQIMGLTVLAVPAYNLVHMRSPGVPYHPKGEGNGYVVDFGGLKVYLAGDTEDTPEMKALTGIDVAFLPMNLPFTMTPEMVAEAARAMRPKVLYPYHTGESDLTKLTELMKGVPGVELRLRDMK
jgi:L-ascorbate metabolism protein UlaG (beta-lactamase superfamily)